VCGSATFRFTSVSAAATKNRSVSIGLPGPMIASHQPTGPPAARRPKAWLLPVKKWAMSTALSPAAFSVPIVW
jgi:hypothetical protein